MPFDYLLSDRLSRTMYNAVTSRLSHSEFDSERNQSRSLRQARVEHEIKKVTAQRDKLLEGLLVAAPAGPSAAQSMRLASYHTGTSAEIESSKPPSISPTRDPMDKLPNHSLRAVVGRVHSVIRKYAPKQQNPSQLAQAIVQESARQGVDPLFVAAVVKTESTFNSSARSHKGAQGLMQIMPATGAWLSQKHDLPRGKLTDPDHNLRLGISYLKHLERTYHGNRVFALVAYNWGPGHVDSAAGGKRKIPKQCMQYALRIMQDYKRWSSGVI
jgi:soluble lytic murein transglycosylase-like protein